MMEINENAEKDRYITQLEEENLRLKVSNKDLRKNNVSLIGSVNKLSKRPLIKGCINEKDEIHKRIVNVKPIKNHYEKEGQSYIKYFCPVCKSVGNKFYLSKGVNNCPCCGVNLLWEE